MVIVDNYVSRIEETCGEEKNFIVILKYERKDEAIKKILQKAKMEKSVASVIFDLNFKGFSIRAYANGKIIFKNLRDKNVLMDVLSELLTE